MATLKPREKAVLDYISAQFSEKGYAISDTDSGDTAQKNITPAMNRADIISALCYALIAKDKG